jgi:hypothetical protein
MASEDISPERVPAEVREYMAAIQEIQDQPFVRQHFHQVTQLSIIVPQKQRADLIALEFRAGVHAALIWKDGQGNWGAGAWLKLAHAEADITCPPTPLSLKYFQGAHAQPSLVRALEALAKTIPGSGADATAHERLTASPPLPSVTSHVMPADVRRAEPALERLQMQASHREYMTRLVCSLVTAIVIAATAYICAWYEFRYVVAYQLGPFDPTAHIGKIKPLTLWEFANSAPSKPMAIACFLAGGFAFPLCFLGSRARPGAGPAWFKILTVHGATAFFAILAAVVISAVHIPSGH